MDGCDLVAGVVALNGGKLVGKTRLQKTLYLLDRDSGLDYEYHYYGPFSEELANAADDAIQLGQLEYEDRPGFHSVPYRIYISKASITPPATLGGLSSETIQNKLEIMNRFSALELEVAATILFLADDFLIDDPYTEVSRKKPLKATPERIARAKQLISDLGTKLPK
ncbi:MAG: hypothetical protein IVW54_06365 [Candidatus Binataceae bacterium]|nr:hypothetical protein [Candidatus Binataceae bacterium]